MRKVLKPIIYGFSFAIAIALAASASASTADIQPAADINYLEAVHVKSALKIDKTGRFLESVHIGSTEAGIGGVTYMNGTIVNKSVDEYGQDTIPVTIGDDLRVDGVIQRLGVGGKFPIKVADTIVPAGDYDLGSNSNKFLNGYFGRDVAVGQKLILGTATPVAGAFGSADAVQPGSIQYQNGRYIGYDKDGKMVYLDEKMTEFEIADGSITEPKLDISNSPTDGQVLSYNTTTKKFEWIDKSGGDNDWHLDGDVLYTNDKWAVAKGNSGNGLLGNDVKTYVNFGVNSTTGADGEDDFMITVLNGFENRATENFSTIVSGLSNTASEELSTVVSGAENSATGYGSFIGSGEYNEATNNDAVVAGGYKNIASGANSAIPGGQLLEVSNYSFGFRGNLGDPLEILDLSANSNMFYVVDTHFHFNPQNEIANFRVDGLEDYLIYTDAANSNVGVGTSNPTPTAKLHINDVLKLEPTDAPGDCTQGEIHYNSDIDKLCYCDVGVDWRRVDDNSLCQPE